MTIFLIDDRKAGKFEKIEISWFAYTNKGVNSGYMR